MENIQSSESQLKIALEQNSYVMGEVLNYLKKRDSPWCDPDEAATILGLKISKSGYHRRVVSYLAKKGFVDRFRPGKPYSYWKEDIENLSIKLAKGEVLIPSKI